MFYSTKTLHFLFESKNILDGWHPLSVDLRRPLTESINEVLAFRRLQELSVAGQTLRGRQLDLFGKNAIMFAAT